MKYTPGLAKPKEGKLMLGGRLEYIGNPTWTIRYLFEEAYIDINTVDKQGRILIHLITA